MPAYGADVLRWWVAESNIFSEVQIGPTALDLARDNISKVPVQEDTVELYLLFLPFHIDLLFNSPSVFVFKMRSTLKFLLGNLRGFDPRVQAVDPKQMHYIDQYMLHLLREFSIKVHIKAVNHLMFQLVTEMIVPV